MKRNKIEIGYLALCVMISSLLLLSSFKSHESHCTDEVDIIASQYTFAITLQPSVNSSLITYWSVAVINGKVAAKKPLTETNFILQMQGKQYSKANLYGINMFEKIAMDECFYKYKDQEIDCNPLSYYRLDDLWTLRYKRNPHCPAGCTPADGMRVQGLAANKTYPSDAQMKILEAYGVDHYTGFFYGDNMFKIFGDINNSEWNSKYAAAQ